MKEQIKIKIKQAREVFAEHPEMVKEAIAELLEEKVNNDVKQRFSSLSYKELQQAVEIIAEMDAEKTAKPLAPVSAPTHAPVEAVKKSGTVYAPEKPNKKGKHGNDW